MSSWNNCVLHEVQEYCCYVLVDEFYSSEESDWIDMMDSFHLKTSVSILEILTLDLIFQMSLSLLLLLPDKHCIGEIQICHEKRSYKFCCRWHQHSLTSDVLYIVSWDDLDKIDWNLLNRPIVLVLNKV